MRYDFNTRWNTSKIISRPNSLRLLHGLTPIWAIWCNGNTPKYRVELGWDHTGAQKPAISPKRCKIWPRLLWRTNRKSHTRLRLVPKSMTLNGRNVLSVCNVQVPWSHGWNTSKIISRLISSRFMLQLTPPWAIWCNGTPTKLGRNRGGVMSAKTCNISETVQDYYTVIRSTSLALQWSQNAWPWMTSKRDSRCFVLALAPDAPASIKLPFRYRLIVKFDTYRYRNLQRHRAVLTAILARLYGLSQCSRPTCKLSGSVPLPNSRRRQPGRLTCLASLMDTKIRRPIFFSWKYDGL